MMLKKIFMVVTILGLGLMLAGCAPTGRSPGVPPDELGWWPSKAEPQPVKDVESEGYYWWPTNPAEETDRLWGNRGYVYVLRYEGDVSEGPSEMAKLPRDVKPVEALQLRDVHFHYDDATLTPAAEKLLLEAVTRLKAHPEISITLEGHACSCGSQSYNLTLALNRADAVGNFLINNGIASERVRTISYGENRPAVETQQVDKCVLLPENSVIRQDHAKNRRVEFRLSVSE